MEMAMTDLREKIVDELRFARSLDDSRTDDEVADRIIALLPKLSELRWDDKTGYLRLGPFLLGRCYEKEGLWFGVSWNAYYHGPFNIEQESRAAVERVAREALGWEA